eukprot:CAMPEP_0114571072 /NCGR_PEP_ID=MMETSP0114-20121206/17554_1 /TAXON_ID=31324 /ORGANISM="Goniomonas sp, Strain m" /LENGTH=173 /DNA_ID=CAMNT_0001758173 /DNA_START=31 /DNA_END=549 /DNA_ORIENTATION=-
MSLLPGPALDERREAASNGHHEVADDDINQASCQNELLARFVPEVKKLDHDEWNELKTGDDLFRNLALLSGVKSDINRRCNSLHQPQYPRNNEQNWDRLLAGHTKTQASYNRKSQARPEIENEEDATVDRMLSDLQSFIYFGFGHDQRVRLCSAKPTHFLAETLGLALCSLCS